MKTERIISWFSKGEEELIGESNIDFIPLDILKKIFNPPFEDPLMYNPYDVNKNESEILKKYIDIEFKFDKYSYQIDCFQI